jgi:hypothetical protein
VEKAYSPSKKGKCQSMSFVGKTMILGTRKRVNCEGKRKKEES